MRDTASKSWRPFGFWALTLNTSLGFPILIAGVYFKPEAPWGTLAGAYASLLATWAVAAGIRQWGKNAGTEE